jgi:hypothetical protein
MGVYGGIGVPSLLAILVIGLMAWVVKQKRQVKGT